MKSLQMKEFSNLLGGRAIVWIVIVPFVLTMTCLVTPFAVAQSPLPHKTIGVISTNISTLPGSTRIDAFWRELRERGWVEGQNLTMESRNAEGRAERLPALADELVTLGVDLIFATGAPAVQAAKQATTTIPIVFETLSDAVAMGFVSNLARPGGNITGVTGFASDLGGKWLDLARKVMPGIRHIALLTNPTNPNRTSILQATIPPAEAMGVELHILEIRNASELENAFAELRGKQVAAVIIPPDALLGRHRRRIAELASAASLPTISGFHLFVEAGCLMSYGTTLSDSYRRAAVYVDKIFRGAAPGDLLVERPINFELMINLKTAKQIGVTIPPLVLFQANKVIQ